MRFLKVDLEPQGYAGFSLESRVTMTQAQLTGVDWDDPSTYAALFGDHDLVDPDGEPLPSGGTIAFANACPIDILMYAHQQAIVHILRGGRSAAEKK